MKLPAYFIFNYLTGDSEHDISNYKIIRVVKEAWSEAYGDFVYIDDNGDRYRRKDLTKIITE